MIERIQAPVSVILSFDHQKRRAVPTKLIWDGQTYQVIKIGFHHVYRQGQVLYHVFSVASKTLFFKLLLDTETLFWTLEEIADGLPN